MLTYCTFDPRNILGQELNNWIELTWWTTNRIIEKTTGVFNMPNNNDTTVIFLRECYEKATRYLKTRAGFIFSDPKSNPEDWSISTWYKIMKVSMLLRRAVSLEFMLCLLQICTIRHIPKNTHNVGLHINTKSKSWHHVSTNISTASRGTNNQYK